MKGALFMSGAVDQSSLADVCRGRYSQCPRVEIWWPGPHLYIGSFCLVGVKLARFESLESRLKIVKRSAGTNFSTCPYTLALACCGDMVQSHQVHIQ